MLKNPQKIVDSFGNVKYTFKENRGGARENAGRKESQKKTRSFRIVPEDKEIINDLIALLPTMKNEIVSFLKSLKKQP